MRNFDFKRYTPRPKKLLRASLIKSYRVTIQSLAERLHRTIYFLGFYETKLEFLVNFCFGHLRSERVPQPGFKTLSSFYYSPGEKVELSSEKEPFHPFVGLAFKLEVRH